MSITQGDTNQLGAAKTRHRRKAPTAMGNVGGRSALTFLRMCPCCGGTRPERSLILCRPCSAKVPHHLRLEAYRAAKRDKSSVAVGDVAARVIASAVKGRMVGAA